MESSQTTLEQLLSEYYIIHLVYHRSKNQHRVQKWWKYFNILHRKVRKLIKLMMDMDQCVGAKADRKHKQVLEVVRYLVHKQVLKKCYYEFNGIIALGQFINLGFTLVGLTSKIATLIMQIDGANELQAIPPIIPTDEQEIGANLEDDLGEIVEESIEVLEPKKRKLDSEPTQTTHKAKKSKPKEFMDDIFGSSQPKKKKSKKPKKKKNDIDDIFG